MTGLYKGYDHSGRSAPEGLYLVRSYGESWVPEGQLLRLGNA